MTDATNAGVWFEIYVDDMPRARAFYEAVFQTQLEAIPTQDDTEMLSFRGAMASYGAMGALVKMEGMKAGGGGTIIYLGCDDCAVEEARVSENGGQVHRPKFSIGDEGFISLVADSEGNVIGLHSTK